MYPRMFRSFFILQAVLLAVVMVSGCAGRAPSLGKTPTQDAAVFYGQGRDAEYSGEYKAAIAAYNKAVRAGSREASLALADMYSTHDIEGLSEKDKDKLIVALVSDAAAQGHTPAMIYLAELYKNGRCVDKDTVKATEWLSRAASEGDSKAQVALAEGYRKICACGLYCSCGPDCAATLWPVEKDTAKAVHWFAQAAAGGDDYAACALGEMYSEGVEIDLNYSEAAKWYKLAAGRGSSTAQNNLANLYLVGQGVPKDYAKAIELYNEALENGSSNTSVINLAELKLYAPAPWGDRKAGAAEVINAAEGGDTYAKVLLGEMYETGRGVKRDYKAAAKWYKEGADSDRAEAMVALGEMYRTGRGVPQDYAEAKRYFDLAVERYNYWGYRGLGRLYALGQGVPRDAGKARAYYLQGADSGDQEAMFLLAEALEHSGDISGARQWYLAAKDYTINQLPRASYTRDFDPRPVAEKARAALDRLGK